MFRNVAFTMYSALLALSVSAAGSQSGEATTSDPPPPDHPPAAQPLDRETGEDVLRRELEEVCAVWSQVDATWNARDAERFSRLFADDVSFRFVQRGRSLDGREAILEHFRARFPHYAPDLRHRTRISAVYPIAPGVVTTDGKVEILRLGDDGDAAPTVLRTFAIFAVMSGKDDDWSIRTLRIYELSPATDDTGKRGRLLDGMTAETGEIVRRALPT